jgi:hypothetical protein
MESFMPQQNNEKNGENHKQFFSWDNVRSFASNTMLVSGAAFGIAGIYETLSGEKIDHMLPEIGDKLPAAINWLVTHVEHLSGLQKAGVGSSFISSGLALTGYLDPLFETKEEEEK